MRRKVYLPCCLVLACAWQLHAWQTSAPSTSGADDTKKILQIENTLLSAYIHGDTAALGTLRLDDFIGVGLDGETWSKQSDIEDVKTGFVVKWFKMTNEKVSFLNPDAALLTYEITYEAADKGRDSSSPHSRVGVVYVRRNGVWRSAYSQETSVKPSDAAANATAPRSPASEADLFFISKEKEVWEALKHKDKMAAAALLADDFVGLEDTGFSTKSEWLKQFDEQYSVDAYAIEDLKLFRPSPTAALLLYKSTCKGTGEWADLCSRPLYISDFWVERNGQWLDLFSQDTQATSGESDDAVPKGIVSNEERIFETLRRNDTEVGLGVGPPEK